MRRKWIEVLVCGLIVFLAGNTVVLAAEISLDDFLEKLLKKHPLFEKERLSAKIEEEEQNSYLGTKDFRLNSSLGYSHVEATTLDLMSPQRSDNHSFSVGLDKLFWQTGGTLSTSLSTQYSDNTPTAYYPETYGQNQLTVSYIQPLLKNRGGFLSKFPYALKDYDIVSTKINSLENQETFLVSSANKFLDWVSLEEQKNIFLERLRLSEEQLKFTQDKRKSNLVDEVDVIRAEDSVRIAKQNLELIKLKWKGMQAELATLLQDDSFYEVQPQMEVYTIEKIVEERYKVQEEQLKTNSRVVKPLKILIDKIKYVRKKYEEEVKADLSLVSSLGLKDADPSYSDSYGYNKPDVSVILKYSIPWGNKTVKSQIKQIDLQLEQINKQKEEVLISLISSLKNLYIQLTQLQTVLKLNEEQIESAKQKTEEELKLYNQGRNQMTFVIQSRDNEQNAKLNYLQNTVLYHKLMLQYRSLLDEVLPYDYKESCDSKA